MSAGKYRKEHNCLNCGAHVDKHYCSDCGQPNLELKESFWGFISHSVAHYFHFDNKFFQTLSPLLTKPGQVTLDYLAGKRARYINPVSMYIFVSIVYFLVVYSPKHVEKDDHESTKIEKRRNENVTDSVKNALKLTGISKEIANKATNSINKAIKKKEFIQLGFADQEKELNRLRAENNKVKSDSIADMIEDYNEIHIERNDSTYAAYLSRQKKLPLSEQDSWYERMVQKRAITIGEKSEVIQETLEHNRPKQFFLLMPLLAWFIMLNFRKNHIYYLDHLIFTIHGMMVYFIVSIFTQPIMKHVFGEDSLVSKIIEVGVTVFLFWYMFKALTIFYQRKTWSTIFKIFWILILYAVAFKLSEMVMINLIYYVAT
jgi:ribosomal protein L37E